MKEQKQGQLTCCAHRMRVPQQPKPFRFSIDSSLPMRPPFLETISAVLVLKFTLSSPLFAVIHITCGKCIAAWPFPRSSPMPSCHLQKTRLKPEHLGFSEFPGNGLKLHLLQHSELYRSDHSSGSHPAIEATTCKKPHAKHGRSVATQLLMFTLHQPFFFEVLDFSLNGFESLVTHSTQKGLFLGRLFKFSMHQHEKPQKPI